MAGSADRVTEEAWEHIDVPTVDLFESDDASFKTLHKLSLKRVAGDEVLPVGRRLDLEALQELSPGPGEGSGNRGLNVPRWAETMARNWTKIRTNFQVMNNLFEETKELNRMNLDTMDREFASIARKLALLDTKIGANSSQNDSLSVWEARPPWTWTSRSCRSQGTMIGLTYHI